ncbi:uncharacterized protein BKA78DRAFT_296805 [Phyllosticta capitalensis]|uniref:uncharacterized protein n=1 Tax=Phyllosticta capitalensis TaxID=121624 RepID=UPI0031316F7E
MIADDSRWRSKCVPRSWRISQGPSRNLLATEYAAKVQGYPSSSSLEIMHRVFRSNDGIAVDDQHINAIRAAKYLPIFGVVLLSFLWKPVVTGLKQISPWSSMSDRWTSASRSVILDYITNTDMLVLFDAGRSRNFRLVVAMAVGFLCGALSPLANSLTYVDSSATRIEPLLLTKNSTFDVDGTLMLPNGSVAISSSHTASTPYAAVALSRLPGGYSSPWTKESYAFESFQPDSDGANSYGLITADIQALSTNFNCSRLNFDPVSNGTGYDITASLSDGTTFGCPNIVPWTFNIRLEKNYIPTNYTTAWLNVSSCDHSDATFLTAIVVILDYQNKTESVFHTFGISAIAGLVCSVGFSTQMAQTTVNASTGEIAGYSLLSDEPSDVDFNLDPVGSWYYLTEFALSGSAEDQKLLNISRVIYGAFLTTTLEVMDTFFGIITGGDSASLHTYIDDQERFQSDVECLANSILTQVIHFNARKNTSIPMSGKMRSTGVRLFIHRGILRVLQLSLVYIGCMAILIAILRLNCSLLQDPGHIATAALALSSSPSSIQKVFAREELSSTQIMQRNMKSLDWKSTRRDADIIQLHCRKSSIAKRCAEDGATESSEFSGWSPFILRFGTKACVGILIAGTMSTLATLLIWSHMNDGLAPDSPFTQNAFHLVSTTVFVIISYACSGIDDAVQEVAPYRYLSDSSKDRSHSTRFRRIWNSHRSPLIGNGFSQLSTATAVLLMPALKIIAAGLYTVNLSTEKIPIQPFMDTSLITHFDYVRTYLENQLNDEVSISAARLVEWSQFPQFSNISRPGTLQNLLFSNLTDIGLGSGMANLTESRVALRAPAISIDVAYQKLQDQFIVQDKNASGCWSIMSAHCNYDNITFVVGPSAQCSENHPYFVGMWMPIWEVHEIDYESNYGKFRTCLVNNSNWASPIRNITPIDVGESLPAEPFNVSTPKPMIITGTVNLTRVFVNVTYAHAHGDTWTPISFDQSSIEVEEQYWRSRALPSTRFGYVKGDGTVYGDTLWPGGDDPEDAMQWLASYAEYNLQNPTDILDEDVWIEAVKSLIVAYNVELLTAYRPFALENATSQGIKPERMNATLYSNEARIFQDQTTTIILEVFLGTILCCYIWIFCRFPSHSVLPKPPGSIAARLSLLAHSDLVRRLKDDGTTRLTDDEIWNKAALGWWKRTEPKGSEGNTSEDSDGDGESRLPPLRWGIDIGEPVSRRAWNDPPESYNNAQSQSEEYQNGDALPLLEEQADIELQSITKPDQAHGEQLDQQQQQRKQEQERQGISSYDEHETGSGGQFDPPDVESQSDQSNKHAQQRDQPGLGFNDQGNFEDWLETQSPNPSLADRSNDAASADQRSEDSGVEDARTTTQQPRDDGASSPLLGRKTQ